MLVALSFSILTSALYFLLYSIFTTLCTVCSKVKSNVTITTNIHPNNNIGILKSVIVIFNTILFTIFNYLENDGEFRLSLFLLVTVEFTVTSIAIEILTKSFFKKSQSALHHQAKM